jgi:hypothetical protein
MTANFEEEVANPKPPALLDANENLIARPAIAKVSTAKFDEVDTFDQDVRPEKPVSVRREELASDDDWDADIPTNTRPRSTASNSGKPSRESFDFDEPSDQEISTNLAAPVSSANGDALKFVPTKSRSKAPAKVPVGDTDEPW